MVFLHHDYSGLSWVFSGARVRQREAPFRERGNFCLLFCLLSSSSWWKIQRPEERKRREAAEKETGSIWNRYMEAGSEKQILFWSKVSLQARCGLPAVTTLHELSWPSQQVTAVICRHYFWMFAFRVILRCLPACA